MMFDFATAPLWKILTAGAGVVCIVLTALLMASTFENRSIVKQRDMIAATITDPKTGYVVRLAQAATNVEQLKSDLMQQRLSFKTESDKQNVALRDSEARLAAAQEQTKAMSVKLTRFLATKPQGDTLDARVRDIDNRAMSEIVE